MKEGMVVPSAANRGLRAIQVERDDGPSRGTKPIPSDPSLKSDAVQVDIRRPRPEPVRGYDRPAWRPPVGVEVKPIPPDNLERPGSPTFKGLYREEGDGSTLVALDGIFLKIAQDGSVEGTLFAPKGEVLKGKGTFLDGKVVVEWEKIGTYSGEIEFVKGGVGKIADGAILLSHVQYLGGAQPPPPQPVPEPVHGVKPAVTEVLTEKKRPEGKRSDEPVAADNGFRGRVSRGGSFGPELKVRPGDLAELLMLDDEK